MWQKVLLGYVGGPRRPFNNKIEYILLSSYCLTNVNLYVKYESNPIRNFKVLEHDKMSAGAA